MENEDGTTGSTNNLAGPNYGLAPDRNQYADLPSQNPREPPLFAFGGQAILPAALPHVTIMYGDATITLNRNTLTTIVNGDTTITLIDGRTELHSTGPNTTCMTVWPPNRVVDKKNHHMDTNGNTDTNQENDDWDHSASLNDLTRQLKQSLSIGSFYKAMASKKIPAGQIFPQSNAELTEAQNAFQDPNIEIEIEFSEIERRLQLSVPPIQIENGDDITISLDDEGGQEKEEEVEKGDVDPEPGKKKPSL